MRTRGLRASARPRARVVVAVCGLGVAGCTGSFGPPTGGSPRGGDDRTYSNGVCAAAAPAVGTGPWRRLTLAHYVNTVRDLLGVEADTTGFLFDTNTGPFATNAQLAPQDADIDRYRAAAEDVAAKAVANPAALTACDPGKSGGEDACAAKFIADFGARAYRRPLTGLETDAFTKVYQAGKGDGYVAGLRLVIEAALQSPSFLYRVEPDAGKGVRKLTGHEVATRLSFLLWGSTPDAPLSAAAREGKLDTAAGVKAAAERLLGSPRFLEAATAFHTQLAEVSALDREGVVTKPQDKYPDFDAELRAAMVGEIGAFTAHMFETGTANVETLLKAPLAFPAGPLARVYGVAPQAGPLSMSDGSRVGLLTMPGVLTTHPAVPTHYGAVMRGHLIRRNFLCDTVPPPTVAVQFNLPKNADRLSQQEILRVHRENPTCKPCHDLMDPLGFALEAYDGIGRNRSTGADGAPIDTSGELIGTDVDGRFDNARGLAEKLAASKRVRACMATQWFRFALARDVQAADKCTQQAVEAVMANGPGDLRTAVLTLVASDAFRYHRGE